jgi:hypothetical protein
MQPARPRCIAHLHSRVAISLRIAFVRQFSGDGGRHLPPSVDVVFHFEDVLSAMKFEQKDSSRQN